MPEGFLLRSETPKGSDVNLVGRLLLHPAVAATALSLRPPTHLPARRNLSRCAANGRLPPRRGRRSRRRGNVGLPGGRTRHSSYARAPCFPPASTNARVAAPAHAPKLMAAFTNSGCEAKVAGACHPDCGALPDSSRDA